MQHIQSIYRSRMFEFKVYDYRVMFHRGDRFNSVCYISLQFNCAAVAGCHFIRIYDMKWRQSFVYSNDQLNNQCRHERCALLHLIIFVCIHMSADFFSSVCLQANCPNSSFESMSVCAFMATPPANDFSLFIHRNDHRLNDWTREKINQMDALSNSFAPHRNGILIDLCDDKIDYFIAFKKFQDKSVFSLENETK